jgi:prophage antirepressor-like protein
MSIIPFTYEGRELRFLADELGNPEVVAADLAKALGHADATHMLRAIDDDEKGLRLVETLGGGQQMTVLTEAGMYQAILQRQTGRMTDPTQKTAVKAFQRWVTHEVLPQIRRTGSYAVADQVPKSLPEALRAYAREVEARQAMEAYAMELEPKADAYQAFMDADGTYAVGTVAKMLGLSQNKLFAELRNRGVMIAKGAMRNTPYQRFMHHFAVKAFDYTRGDGTTGTSYTTRVQPSGVDFIRRQLGLPAVEEVAA